MSGTRWRGALAVWASLFTVLLPGSPAALASGNERARIVQERRALAQPFDDQEAECRTRFAVTGCIDEVRARRRAALAPLRDRELRLDEAERHERAAERRRAVAAKQAALAASRPPAAPAPQVRVRSTAAGASHAAAARRMPREAPASAAARQREADERRSAAERRQEQAEAVRERIDRRQSERAAAGRRAEPLPASGAAR